jgi:hypothetical protein
MHGLRTPKAAALPLTRPPLPAPCLRQAQYKRLFDALDEANSGRLGWDQLGQLMCGADASLKPQELQVRRRPRHPCRCCSCCRNCWAMTLQAR